MRVFLLGPGYFEGDSSRKALPARLRLAQMMTPHECAILEISDLEAPDLTVKFKTAMDESDAVIVWLPRRGRLATVFGGLLLLRYEDGWHGRQVTLFAEQGVIDASGQDFQVMDPSGQIAFLRDLPKCYDLQVFEYSTVTELDRLIGMYSQGLLET